MTTVSTPHFFNQSARRFNSAVQQPKRCVDRSVRSVGTLTQCSEAPISIPAALGLATPRPWVGSALLTRPLQARRLLLLLWRIALGSPPHFSVAFLAN